MEDWRLEDVVVERRHRLDLGDLTELCDSIDLAGQIRPITVTRGGVLISGLRRLEATRELGYKYVAVSKAETLTQASKQLAVDLEFEAGARPMRSIEMASLGLMLEDLPREKGGGETRALVSAALGIGMKKWERLRVVAKALQEGELPESVVDELDRTGIRPVFERLKRLRGEPPVEPKQFVITSKRTRQVAEKARGRLSTVMGQLDGYCEVLPSFDVGKVLALAEPDEVREWLRILGETNRVLRNLKTELQKGA